MIPVFSYYIFLSLLLLSPPTFPARTLPPQPQKEITVNLQSSTWNNFLKFVDAGKGSQLTGMSELKSYFQHFGYLPVTNTNFTDKFDDNFESAVITYQKKLGLPVTGKLDTDTMQKITTPRCGITDTNHKLHIKQHYTYFQGEPRWVKSAPLILSYAFTPQHMIDYIPLSEIKHVFERAFSRWSSVIPVNFTETKEYNSADIKIGFYKGDHGDGDAFDGVLGVLAHAFSPVNGRLHLDGAETWAVDFKTEKSKVAVDLESLAMHEIGHILGLAHTSVQDAIMYPSLSTRTKKVELKLDDVEGIQALYGSNPSFDYSSLFRSDISSSCRRLGLERGVSNWVHSLFIWAILVLHLCL